MGQYDFNSLYGQADSSIFVYDAGEVDAVVESSTWGRTKAGDKGQWDVRFRVTTGPNAGRAQIRFPMTVTSDNPQALGIMFRHLECMGIPTDWIKTNPPEEQIAQAMVGKPVLLRIVVDEYEGVNRNKVRDVRPARPGAPTTWPTFQQPQAPGYGQAPYGQPQYGQQPMYPGQPSFQQPLPPGQMTYQQPAPPPQQDPWAMPQQPQMPPQQNPYGAPQPPQAAPAGVAPWQQPQGAPAQNGAAPGGVPPWAQAPVPDQQQAPANAFNPNGSYAPPQQGQPQQPQGGAPAPSAPWASPAPTAEQQGGPQGAPPPPWAQ